MCWRWVKTRALGAFRKKKDDRLVRKVIFDHQSKRDQFFENFEKNTILCKQFQDTLEYFH